MIKKFVWKYQYLGCPQKKLCLHIFCNTENTYILILLKFDIYNLYKWRNNWYKGIWWYFFLSRDIQLLVHPNFYTLVKVRGQTDAARKKMKSNKIVYHIKTNNFVNLHFFSSGLRLASGVQKQITRKNGLFWPLEAKRRLLAKKWTLTKSIISLKSTTFIFMLSSYLFK